MLRHVAMFRWAPGTTTEQVAEIEARLRQLRDAVSEIRDYRFGRDAGINAGNFDFVVTADFASAADYAVYRDHPAHRALVADVINPCLGERASVQYEC
jgi:Stress responsive A/B Barrel Domain